MKIKHDPISKLWCREDGAVLMPPCRNIHRFTYAWTFGTKTSAGYCIVTLRSKIHYVHQMVCRAFNRLAPEDKPFVDHIDRCKANNAPSNLRWVDRKENAANQDCVDKSFEKYGVRQCEDKKAYSKAYNRSYWAAKYVKMKAQGLIWKWLNGKWGWYPPIRT